jgi:putative ABC transport system permease protein
MFRLTIKGLWAHKLRFVLTGLAVVLGVGFMAGTMILTDTMGKTFDGIFTTANEGIDVVVQSDGELDTRATEAHERLPESLLASVRAVDGVAAAEGSIQGFAQLVDADGNAGISDGLEITIGSNWVADGRLNPLDLAEGRAPAGPNEVVLDKATADREGFGIGDSVTVLSKAAPRSMTVVGIATYGPIDGLPGTTLVATDTATAQELFAQPGTFDSIAVAAEPGVTPEELSRRVGAALAENPAVADESVSVVTGEQDTADKQAEMKEDLSFFNTFLLSFAYVALFVGTFIIYNTFSIVVAQRTRDMAMLRAIGASRRQVLRSVLLEALLVGVVAAAVGLGLGVVLSHGLRALLNAVGLAIPGGTVVITSGTVALSAIVGIAVTVVSAMAPARRAGRVRPIAALRESAVDTAGRSLARPLIGLAMSGLGVTMFAAGMSATGESALSLIGLGALVTILGVFVLGPTIARPVLRVLGVPAVKVSGTTGRLARENARRNPRRTAATASALMIGVALVGFITILAASTKTSVEHAVDHSLRADYVVESGSWGEGGFSPELATQLAAQPGIEAVSPLRTAPVDLDGSSTELNAVDTSVIDRLYDLDLVEGSLVAVTGNAIAVDVDFATTNGLALGDTVTATFADGSEVDLTVAALFAEPMLSTSSPWLVDLDLYEAHVADQYDRQVYVTAATGVDAATSRAAIEQVLDQWPNAELLDQAGFKQSVTEEIDQILNLIYGLLALAVVIALIGVANTLALSVHERTREIGLLRAVGMTRGQVKTSVRWESVMIALLGTVLGAVLAVAGAWGIVKALDTEGVTSFTVPAAQLTVIVVIAIVAGVAAAVGPARRAARLDVLAAIATA